ncbi:MAG TPA: ABC transporter permease, partial [Chthoniobacterales bacterium]|nr:ABC transporter permease [Chthoniobacterales bacterium]
MDSILQDLNYALRRLLKAPGFASVAILTLALAIGANTTVFSVLNTLILRPLPVDRPQELVFFSGRGGSQNQSYPNYRDFRDRTKTLSGLIAYRVAMIAMSHGGESSRVWGYEASGNYFQVLGIRPALGRFFTAAEDRNPGADPYLVLSYSSWQHRFGGDPNVVNKTVKINGLDYTVLGVAPKGFIGTELLYVPEFWAPMTMEAQLEPGNNWLNEHSTWDVWVLGRIKPGITRKQAQSEIDGIAAQLRREHPKENDGLGVIFSEPGLIGTFFRGIITAFIGVIMAVAGLVLLIACANLASFLLARAADRKRETAIRLALGAGRMRLMRQLLTENLLLAILGGTAGLILAFWLTRLITTAKLPVDFPFNTALSIDTRVLAFAFAISVLTVLFFGLAPALQATRPDVIPALKNETWSRRLRRWELRDVFVTGQIALSVVLLVGSVLVVRSLQNALTVNVGFNPRNAASVSFDVGLQGYNEARGRDFQKRLLEKVRNLPGIESASIANAIPLSLDVSNTSLLAYGKPVPRPSEAIRAIFYYAGPDFFHTLETRVLEGREFNWRDTPDSRLVVVVNKALANRLFPGEDPIGKRVCQGESGPWREIVGVVEDGKYESLNDENQPVIFWPMLQRYENTTTLVARSHLAADRLIGTLRKAVREMDPTMPVFDATTLENHLSLPLAPAHLAASALGAFGFIAVVLAAIGVYGVMAYAVARRTREIGIRMAIGATRSRVFSLIVKRTAMVLVVGTLFGTAAALTVGRFFSA